MRVLITAGPTREHWDAVRFLSSGSTGRMGFEIAEAAVAAGHEAVLVLGPTHLPPPEHPSIRVRRVVSARDLLAVCVEEWDAADALVAAAAVADYRPASPHDGKRTKTEGPVTLELVRNPDVLATLAESKGERVVVGFALQVEDGLERAREKLVRKRLDAIVLDGPEALGASRSDFTLLAADGTATPLLGATKAEVARAIVALL